MMEQRGPNTVLLPARAALKDTVPFAEMLRRFTPMGAVAQDPVNCFDETRKIFLVSGVNTPVPWQECLKFLH